MLISGAFRVFIIDIFAGNVYDIFDYCSLVVSREVFFVSEGHRKPETYGANLCD